MQSFASVKKEFFKKDPTLKKIYNDLAPEFALAAALIEKRLKKEFFIKQKTTNLAHCYEN